MKIRTIIILTIVVYIVALFAMFFGVQKYITIKNKRLYREICNTIDEIFEHQNQLVDVAYSGYKVGSEEITIPKKPERLSEESFKELLRNLNKKDIDRRYDYATKMADKEESKWDDYYGDIFKMHRVFYNRSDWSNPYNNEDGWNLVIMKQDESILWGRRIYEQRIFPYAVGYKKQVYQWKYSYLPSVKSAVYEAFDFYTTNSNSQFYKDFRKGSIDEAWSKIYAANNEYYYMEKDEERNVFHSVSNSLFEEPLLILDKEPIQWGYMYNDYYKVFIAATQPQSYTIKKYAWKPDEEEKKDLWRYWSIGLTILFLLIIIPLCIIDRKRNKEKEEMLYDKLKRLCNPANFISKENYDKEKIDKANDIYAKLMSSSPEDKELLNQIQIIAVEELGINLINNDKVQELIEKVNPKNFINPYNADKLALANELYAILIKEGLTYNELKDVEEKAKQL